MPPSDRVWRERGLRDAILAGDQRAWQALYNESFAELFAYAQWRCAGLRDLAEEVTQETWLVAVRRVASFDPEQGSFLNWLRGIAANLVRNYLRRPRERRTENRGQRTEDREHRTASSGLEEREQAEQVARALAQMPEQYEAVLRGKYLEQLSVAEIAERQGESIKAVESMLSRAREAFRNVYPVPSPVKTAFPSTAIASSEKST